MYRAAFIETFFCKKTQLESLLKRPRVCHLLKTLRAHWKMSPRTSLYLLLSTVYTSVLTALSSIRFETLAQLHKVLFGGVCRGLGVLWGAPGSSNFGKVNGWVIDGRPGAPAFDMWDRVAGYNYCVSHELNYWKLIWVQISLFCSLET